MAKNKKSSKSYRIKRFEQNHKTGEWAVAVLLAIIVGFLVGGFITPPHFQFTNTIPSATLISSPTLTKTVVKDYSPLPPSANRSFATVRIPAVDEQGNGVVTNLDVEIVPGSGRILANIDKLLFWVDTQTSIRTAKAVAEEYTQTDLSKYDIIYTVRANATVIEGGSAGAALTIATIGAIQNKPLKQDVIMTGTINPDGTIGPVGEVLPKAKAAKDVGATKFLVPTNQGSTKTYEKKKTCEQIGSTELCTVETIPTKVSIDKEVGIDVIEVKDVKEAIGYFVG